MKRFEAPLIIKQYFYLPGNENAAKNAGHLRYIGKRSGVVIEDDYELEPSHSGIYTDLDELDEVDYRHQTPVSDASIHIQYAAERPRSHGLFSNQEIDLGQAQREIRAHEGIVWRTVVSLTESDALRLGYKGKTQWEDMLKVTVPMIANHMGIQESNLRWVAAYHAEKGHPHVHIMMWEKRPDRKLGMSLKKERIAIKKTFIQEIYGAERIRLAQEKTADRDLIRDLAKNDLLKAVSVVRETRNLQNEVELELRAIGAVQGAVLTDRLHKDTENQLYEKLKDLSELLPQKGRLAYKYMPEPIKTEVDRISEWILQQPAQRKVMDRYLQTVEDMTLPYTAKQEEIQAAKDNARQDICKRISQVVLKASSEAKVKAELAPLLTTETSQSLIAELKAAEMAPPSLEKQLITPLFEQIHAMQFGDRLVESLFANWRQAFNLRITPEEIRARMDDIFNKELTGVSRPELKPDAAATFMRFGGLTPLDVKELLRSRTPLAPADIDQIVKRSEQSYKEATENKIPPSEWKAMETLCKAFDIKDIQQRVVSLFTKVLFIAGQSKEQALEIIQEWNGRSGSKIDPGKLGHIINESYAFCEEGRTWNRAPVITRKDYYFLQEHVGFSNTSWPFVRNEQHFEKNSFQNAAQGIWKAVFRGMEQERMQNEAKSEMLKRQIAREQTRKGAEYERD